MRVGDLVKLKAQPRRSAHSRLGEPVGIVTEEGQAASSGIIWWVVFGEKREPVFEDDLEIINEAR